MDYFLSILNNPAVISAIVGLILAGLSLIGKSIYVLIHKVTNSKKILEGYKTLFGRLEATLGSKLKQASSLKEIAEIILEFKKETEEAEKSEKKVEIKVK